MSDLQLAISSQVNSETLLPYTMVQVLQTRQPGNTLLGQTAGSRILISVLMDPATARRHAHELLQAAEAAEHHAHTILALREQKIPEDVVVTISERLKQKRVQ